MPVKVKQEPTSDDEKSSRHSHHFDRPSRETTNTEDRPPKFKQQQRRKSPRSEDAEAANYQYGQQVKDEAEEEVPVEKQKPNFGLSGKLTEEKNVFNGVVVKYSEPPEARIPKRRWRFYVFKGDETLPTLYLHRQSAYLIGRDRKVADIPIDHPSCSKQHAAIQFRLVNYDRPDGTAGRTVRPYIIDLEAANGTFVNNQKIESKRYVELFEKDVVKFGFSSREYVLLHEESKTDASLDDMGVGE
jgi:smad nuclear-interacting protein 1